jgi:hypothetical protein
MTIAARVKGQLSGLWLGMVSWPFLPGFNVQVAERDSERLRMQGGN